jgi:transcription initiation factor TFIIF subunit alpha
MSSNSKDGPLSGQKNGSSGGTTTSYTDYKLVAPNPASFAWKHNIMRLVPPGHVAGSGDRRRHKEVHLERWNGPVKLNRRDERKLMALEDKPAVKSEDGTVKASDKISESATAEEGRKQRYFQKKTRRVFETEESKSAYKLARQERNPWVLEDLGADTSADKTEMQWTGRLDGSSGSGNSERGTGYVLLLMENDENGDAPATFTVLPTHRTYKFTTKPKYRTLQADEAEEEVSPPSQLPRVSRIEDGVCSLSSMQDFRRSRILLLPAGKCGAQTLPLYLQLPRPRTAIPA